MKTHANLVSLPLMQILIFVKIGNIFKFRCYDICMSFLEESFKDFAFILIIL